MPASRRTQGLIASLLALSTVFAAGAADAGQRIYSYDSATPITRKMTENGLTFIFEKSLMSTRVLSIVETHDVGSADLRPADPNVLGRGGLEAVLGPDAREHDLYEITMAKDGKALSRALCHGSDKAWLAVGPLKMGQDLRVRAIGRDPATGKAWLCVTLDYNYHGEWALPPPDLPQPSREDPFNDAPANRRF
jgi:hypothetical protein